MKKIRVLLFGCLCAISHFAYALDIGVGVHPQDFSDSPEKFIALLKKYQIKTFRTDYFWSQVEKKQGEYHPTNVKLEQVIKLAKQNNIKPLIIFDYGNSLYDEATTTNPKRKPISEESVNAFVNYVRWSTQHLKENVEIYEIWNEWIQIGGKNNKDFNLSDLSARQYSNLILKSCLAIKNIQPNAKVIAGSIPLGPENTQWMIKVLNNGAGKCLDGVSLHTYDYVLDKSLNPNKIAMQLDAFQSEIYHKTGKKNTPLYITEVGAPNSIQAIYSLNDTASYFENYVKQLSSLNYVKGIWWYDFINDGDNPNEKEHNFGILNRDFSPKPIAKIFPKIIQKYDQ